MTVLENFAEKLGKEDFKVSAANFVDILNCKFGTKESGKPFTYSDVQQYYIRGYIPEVYGGFFIERKKDETGSYLQIYKDRKENGQNRAEYSSI